MASRAAGRALTGNVSDRVGSVKLTESLSDGFNVGARAGYEWGPIRFEEEFSFANNHATRLAALGGSIPVSGERNRYALMTNAIYDFPVGWIVSPHIGFGIGAVNLHDSIATKPPLADVTLASSSDWQFGYQGIAGIRYNINPALAFDLDYRYLATTDPTFKPIGGVKYKSEYSTHNVVASLSVRFGAAAAGAAGPAAAAGRAAKVFLVFFDWDEDTITPEGMAIIQQAADAWRAGARSQIQVTGYTDASGSPGYNQRLSERRANNVANALGGSACRASRWSSAAAARTTSAYRPPTVCASRRTAASRSSSRNDRTDIAGAQSGPGALSPPRSARRFFFVDQRLLAAAGSSRCCKPSPSRLQATTVRKIISPG